MRFQRAGGDAAGCGLAAFDANVVNAMARRSPPPLVLCLCGLIAVTIGIVLLVWMVAARQDQARANTVYLPTTGTVLSAKISEHMQSRRQPSFWSVERAYSYAVAGRTYEGDRRAFETSLYDDRQEAERDLERLPVGSAIEVFYDPADPTQSVLDRSPPGFGAFVLPAGPLAFGALLLVVARRDARSRGASARAAAATAGRRA
ncbi:MAG: DUF3592 domain-containing protein [Planctomycetes bacterium]|nr:DUF3592 domain-containing protein [Planctomycetota bacterium]